MKKAIKILLAVMMVAVMAAALTACDKCKDGHTWDEGVVTTAATCSAPGVRTFTCQKCGETKELEIPKVAHTWDEGAETTAPTCTEDGQRTYTCTVCKQQVTETIDKLGHSYDDGVVTTPATCTSTGVKTFTCQTCQATYTEEIARTDHQYGEWIEEADGVVGHFECESCHRFFDADHKEILDLRNLPTEEGKYTLYWQSDVTLPDYVSIWFTGGSTKWGLADEGGFNVEAKHIENSSFYYVIIEVDSSLAKFDNYVLALGYNAHATEINPDKLAGLDYSYKSDECAAKTDDTNMTFVVSEDSQYIDLGSHTFSKLPRDPALPELIVEFQVEFDGALPDGYNVYLAGEMFGAGEWADTARAMEPSANGRTYSVSVELKEGGTFKFKVVLCMGAFSWTGAIEYGGTADSDGNASVTVTEAGVCKLFPSAQKAPQEEEYIIVGSKLGWDTTTTNMNQIFSKNEDGTYSITHTFTMNETFKVKKNEEGWDWQINCDSTRHTTFASGVENVDGLFFNASDQNICAKFACTATITLDVAQMSLSFYVTQVTVTQLGAEEYILVGSFNTWGETQSDSKYILKPSGGDVYTITYTFAVGDQFKIKLNADGWTKAWGWHNENVQGSAKANFEEGKEANGNLNGNFSCIKACTVTITINISTGVITLS